MKIVELFIDEYKDYPLDCHYVTRAFYDVIIKKKKDINIKIKRKKMRKQEKGFDAKLFESYIEKPNVYGIFDKKKLIAVIEGSLETWNNRYRIWNFWVDKKYRREGFGTYLFKHIVDHAIKIGSRAIILEVQSCNDPAISFYLSQGLHFVGLNTMEYSNNDIEKREVRIEMGRRL
jgi:ribosomal protein S18 acetylase RimI-like enzyme